MHYRTMKAALSAFILALLWQAPLGAQSEPKHEDSAKPIETGTFHGKVHSTSGRATTYQETDGKLLLRLTHFKASKGVERVELGLGLAKAIRAIRAMSCPHPWT